MFAPLHGEAGKNVIKEFDLDTSVTDSILLYSKENGLKIKSAAALAISSKLGFPRNLMLVFYIIPPFIRNWVYDYVAKNRYSWYGKMDQCMIPSPELEFKFIK